MTYEEALKIKKTYEPSYLHNRETYFAKIVPSLEKDRNEYFADLRKFDISDEESRKYSTNKDFTVRGFSANSSYQVEQHDLS